VVAECRPCLGAFICICVLAAWFGMNDLATTRASFSDQAVIFKRKHNWIMCWLYLGTFGSFIATRPDSAADQEPVPHINALSYAWLGPLVGALIRPFGGWLSDKLGGAQVSFWNFIAMAFGVLGVLYFLPQGGRAATSTAFWDVHAAVHHCGRGQRLHLSHDPVIFLNLRERAAAGRGKTRGAGAARRKQGSRRGAGLLLGDRAYGGFFIR